MVLTASFTAPLPLTVTDVQTRRCAIRSLEKALCCAAAPLTPRQRGLLRSEAGRRLVADKLAHYVVVAPEDDDETAVALWATKYTKAVSDLLGKYELVKVKVRGAGKRKRAARLAEALANDAKAQVAQSIGHTVLLFRGGPKLTPLICDDVKEDE